MTQTSASAPAIKLPANILEADKLIRPKVIWFTLVIAIVLMGSTIGVPVLSAVPYMVHHPWLVNAIGLLSGALILAVFYTGAGRIAKTLVRYGRHFVAIGSWEDAETVLSTFSQWHQRFLDPTGEANYLLQVALTKRGKYETARKVQAWLLKARAGSEWAQKLVPAQKAPAAKAAAKPAAPAGAAQEKHPRPSKAKRRRY